MSNFKSYNLRMAEKVEEQHRREAEGYKAEVEGYERLISEYEEKLANPGIKPRDRAFCKDQMERTGRLLARSRRRAGDAEFLHGKALDALEHARAREKSKAVR